MDQGPEIGRTTRRQVRATVMRLLARPTDSQSDIQWITDTYCEWPGVRAYALAYYGAVQTGVWLEWDQARDKRS